MTWYRLVDTINTTKEQTEKVNIMRKEVLSRTVTRTYCFENESKLVVSRLDRRGLGMGIRWVYSFHHANSYQTADRWEHSGGKWAWVDAQECADRYALSNGKILKVKYSSDKIFEE